jgi:hypothetical protein
MSPSEADLSDFFLFEYLNKGEIEVVSFPASIRFRDVL